MEGNKSPELFVIKPFCKGDLLPARKIFIERPVYLYIHIYIYIYYGCNIILLYPMVVAECPRIFDVQ